MTTLALTDRTNFAKASEESLTVGHNFIQGFMPKQEMLETRKTNKVDAAEPEFNMEISLDEVLDPDTSGMF